MIEQHDLDVGPIAFVGLVAYREVEAGKAAADRMAKQLVEMSAPGTEAGELAVIVARQDQVVATAKFKPDVDRRYGVPDVQPADMHQLAQVAVARDREAKVAPA